jgi:O-antigen ligase
MPFLVLLLSGFFLASLIVLHNLTLQVALAIAFAMVGVLVTYRIGFAYLAFLLVYPLIPSHPEQLGLGSFDYVQFIFLCFAFWWSIYKIRSKTYTVPESILNLPVGIFVAICALSVVLAILRNHLILSEVFFLKVKDSWNVFSPPDPSDQLQPLRRLVHLLEGTLLFFITIDVLRNEETIVKALRVIIFSALGVSLLGIFQYIFKFQLLEFWVKENPNLVRIHSTFDDPNALGSYLAAIFCLSFAGYWNGYLRRRRWNLLALLTILIALVFTGSRAALFATGGGLVIFVAAKLVATGNWRILKYAILGTLSAFALLVLVAFLVDYRELHPHSFWQVVLFTFNPNLPLDVILKGRVELWQTVFAFSLKSPTFGYGLGSLNDLFKGPPFYLIQLENAHNYFLQVLIETGILALLLFIFIAVIALRKGVVQTNSSLSQAVSFGLIAFLLTCVTGHPLLLLKLQFFFWTLIGIAVASRSSKISPGLKKGMWIAFLGMVVIFPFQAFSTLKTRQIPSYEIGYHEWEQDPDGGVFRWTKYVAISELQVQGEVLELRLRNGNPIALNKPVIVKIYLQNELIDSIAFSDVNWKLFLYYLPIDKRQRTAKLRIECMNPFKWPGDVRRLGIAVRPFSWRCASDVEPIGVYPLEKEGSKSYYWTSGQASFPLARDRQTLQLSVTRNPGVAKQTAVFYWNDKKMETKTFEQDFEEKVSLKIPPEDGILTIRTSDMWNPRAAGVSEDSRQLGLRVDWPFHWKGVKTPAHSNHSSYLNYDSFYGISSSNESSLQYVLWRSNSDFKGRIIDREFGTLEYNEEIATFLNRSNKHWIQLFPEKPEKPFYALVGLQDFKRSLSLTPGTWLIRLNAAGTLAAGELALLEVRLNESSFVRQPILPGEYRDYYLVISLKKPAKEIALNFLNDYYNPVNHADRNLVIRELAISKINEEEVNIRTGWAKSPDQKNSILIAEPWRNSFSPINYCYRVEESRLTK